MIVKLKAGKHVQLSARPEGKVMLVVVIESEKAGYVDLADEADRNPFLQGPYQIVFIKINLSLSSSVQTRARALSK